MRDEHACGPDVCLEFVQWAEYRFGMPLFPPSCCRGLVTATYPEVTGHTPSAGAAT